MKEHSQHPLGLREDGRQGTRGCAGLWDHGKAVTGTWARPGSTYRKALLKPSGSQAATLIWGGSVAWGELQLSRIFLPISIRMKWPPIPELLRWSSFQMWIPLSCHLGVGWGEGVGMR